MSEASEEVCGWMLSEDPAFSLASSSTNEANNLYIEMVIQNLQSEPVLWPGLGVDEGADLFRDVGLLNGRVTLILLDSLSPLR